MGAMSALITQTIDEELKILLIAVPSKLSQVLAEKIKEKWQIEVTALSPTQLENFTLLENKKNSQNEWYKIIFLLEHPVKNNQWQQWQKVFEKLPVHIPIIPIIPFSTAVADAKISLGWKKQVDLEYKLFNNLIKKIDLSTFIFYKDVICTHSYPTVLFFKNLKQNVLLDPELEFTYQSEQHLADKITQFILRPRHFPILIQGKSRRSTLFIDKIKEYYLSFYQQVLRVKKLGLIPENHPILNSLSKELMVIESEELISSISREIVITLNRDDFLLAQKKDEKDKAEQKKQPENEAAPQIIDSIFKQQRQQQKKQHLAKLRKKTQVGLQKIKTQKFLFGGGLLVTLTALLILILSGVYLFKLSQTENSFLSYLQSRSMPMTVRQKKLTLLEEKVNNLSGKTAIINQWFSTPYFSKVFQLLEMSKYIVKLTDQTTALQTATANFYQQVMLKDGSGSLEEVNKKSADIFKTTSLLSAELKSYPQQKLKPAEVALIEDYQKTIKNLEKKLNQFQQLSPIIPSLLAQDDEKVYALLLQNNQELRPTGGFIQAVAFLTFKDGKLINVQVEDVYTLDQQLKAALTPPDEIQKLLGEKKWYLRDSNWNPNFPDTAKQVKWFLNKSVGINVDGVIGINLKVLEQVMSVLGEVDLADYNEVLTKRNLQERAEFHSEVQLIDSGLKRDYLESILSEILNQVQKLPPEKVTPLLSALLNMADKKELVMSFFDEDVAATIEALAWDGSLVTPTCPTVFKTDNCVVDSIMQVEANIGVNKANYYLERQIDHTISISPQKVEHKRVISFKNKAQTNAWPKGPYRAYIRFYLNKDATISKIYFNNKKIGQDKITLSQTEKNQVVGVVIEVPVKSEAKLQLEYSVPIKQRSPFSYTFFDQKQPGARDVSPRVFLQYDPDLSPTLIAPQAEVQGNLIVFNPSQDQGQNQGNLFVGASFE